MINRYSCSVGSLLVILSLIAGIWFMHGTQPVKQYVIIGSSAAGFAAAKRLRELDASAHIVCLQKEPVIPYNRCKLVGYLGKRKQEADIVLCTWDELERLRIDFRIETEALSIDRNAQKVKIISHANQQTSDVSYDSLLIATGTYTQEPMPLRDREGVFTVSSFSDAKKIEQYSATHTVRNIAIVGGGLTALETADDLVKCGYQVTLLLSGRYPLARAIEPKSGALLMSALKESGVTLYPESTIAGVQTNEDQRISKIILADGSIIDTDMIICATGQKPASQLAQSSGIILDESGGIVVDTHMRTDDPHIFAAGDVVMTNELSMHRLANSCKWNEAKEQGRIAAENMTGNATEYAGFVTSFGSSLFGLKIISVGPVTGMSDDYVTTSDEHDNVIIVRTYVDNRLQGMLVVGRDISKDIKREVLSLKREHSIRMRNYK